MAIILNIDTSTDVCSVALSGDGMILCHNENSEGHNHATLLSGFIKEALDYASSHELKLDAVAVTLGPGSYTGLRIGLSEAKGLAYALGLPLIGIDTLRVIAVGAMFTYVDITPDTIIVPMIDARRSEVYTAAYDMSLDELMKPQAHILTEESYATLLATGRPVIICGDGAAKASTMLHGDNLMYLPGITPLATHMVALSEQAWRAQSFVDTAYVTPLYLKEYQAVKAKPMF